MKIIRYILLLFLGISLIGAIVLKGQHLRFFTPSSTNETATKTNTTATTTEEPSITVLAENLDTPWAIAFLPDNSMLVTERPGRVRHISPTGTLDKAPIATLEKVREIGEGGLLGMTIHPQFPSNHLIYFYYTYSSTGENTLNRVVRMTYEGNTLKDEKIIVDAIPGASNHNGGRIKFGPDNMLYIGTGDAEEPSRAQDTKSLAGKILRVTDEGKPAPGNSFGNAVYSYGHRNVQGLAWDEHGNLWATEHGRSGITSGYDELNRIENGNNYGWPTIQGDTTRQGMIPPRKHSGATTTWAPSGAAFVGTSLFFGGLRGQSLYEASIDGNTVKEVKEHFKGEYGRIRDVILGPDNMLYVTTSNQDGRGNPSNTDDKIIRINPSTF